MVVPNRVKLYGTGYKAINAPGTGCDSEFHQDIYITKTHVKAVDQPSRRCDSATNSPDITACIASFIEHQIECSPNIPGSQYPLGNPCDTEEHQHRLENITGMLQNADENEIYEMTGCLSSCSKDQYTLNVDPITRMFDTSSRCEYHIRFKILDMMHKEEEQYIIYDTGSFFADVGGFMGLLLGWSLSSLYMAIEALLKNLCDRSNTSREANIA